MIEVRRWCGVLLGAAACAAALSRAPLADQAAAAPRRAIDALDHLILAVPDLEQGVNALAARTGVIAIPGGSHPGKGTCNALLSLGEGHYLEIIAPDPAQPESKQGSAAGMAELKAPLLGGWAVTSSGIAAELERIRARGLAMVGPFPGDRARPDGRRLSWQTAFAPMPLAQSLPFLIEWGAESPHPSLDAPVLGRLVALTIVTPDPAAVTAALAQMGLDCPVEKGDAPALRARIVTLRGALVL